MATIVPVSRVSKKGVKSTYYYLQYKDDNNNWKRTLLKGVDNRAEANNILSVYNAKEINKEYGCIIRKIKVTISYALTEFKEEIIDQIELDGEIKRDNTLRANKYALKKIIDWFKYKKLDRFESLTKSHINSFRTDLQVEFKCRLGSIKNYQKMLLRFLRWCNEKSYFTKIKLIENYKLIENIEIYNEKRELISKENKNKEINLEEMLFYSEEEIEKILNNLSDQYKDVVEFIYKTGRRVKEAITLKWYEYEKKKRIIRLAVGEGRKIKKEELYPLSAEAIEIIKKQPKFNEFIFNNSTTKKPISYPAIRANFEKALGDNCIRGKKIHALRHTFASELLNKNVNPILIQKLLGHTTNHMTKIYTHPTDENLFDAVNRLNKRDKKEEE